MFSIITNKQRDMIWGHFWNTIFEISGKTDIDCTTLLVSQILASHERCKLLRTFTTPRSWVKKPTLYVSRAAIWPRPHEIPHTLIKQLALVKILFKVFYFIFPGSLDQWPVCRTSRQIRDQSYQWNSKKSNGNSPGLNPRRFPRHRLWQLNTILMFNWVHDGCI